MYYEVIPTKVFRANASILTYSSDIQLLPGHIIEIPLGRGKTVGIVSKKVKKPNFPTKPIIRKIYEAPLPKHILKSIFWLSDYYLCPLPLCANLFLPIGITKNRRRTKAKNEELDEISQKTASTSAKTTKAKPKNPNIPLNPAQKQALEALESASTATKLLRGITGSGKTNIYLKMAENALKRQKSVILLVPEIALTSQLVEVFQNTFKNEKIILIHSRQTEAERHIIWEDILNSTTSTNSPASNGPLNNTINTPKIIIGPRSALLTPVNNLGLILIDEAHEQAYFQESPPKYSALRLASFMASTLKITCLEGTATPEIQDYYLAEKNHAVVNLTKKAKSTAKKPQIKIIDLKNQEDFRKNRYFSVPLLNAIEKNLKEKTQTLIFHNRRGSAPITLCENCGWQALCPHCFLPLTLHTDHFELFCHTCGYHEKIPKSCPNCQHPEIIHKGFGTKLLESELKKLFKNAKIARFDADNTKNNSLDALYDEVKNGDFDIIIGTQTIAKGLDLPLLKTVGIIQADSGLSLPDYATEERTFHLLSQVLGRIGRGHLEDTKAYVQTYQPDHPIISAAIDEDYQAFYSYLLKRRQKAKFPPFYYLAKLNLTYKTETTVLKHIKSYYSLLKSNQNLLVSTPTPAFHERGKNGYTWQIIIKSKNRKTLLLALRSLPASPNLHLTIDPPSLL